MEEHIEEQMADIVAEEATFQDEDSNVGSHYDCDNDDVDDDLIMMAMMMMMMMVILIAAGRAAFFNNNFIDRVVQHLLHQLHLQ